MRILPLGLLLCLTCPARADDIGTAIAAVQAAARKSGKVFATSTKACKNHGERVSGEALQKSESLTVDDATHAVLLTSVFCGGNGVNKTLVIVKNGKPRIIRELMMGDMQFLGDMRYVDGRSIVFHGQKWAADDPHCCPSQQAELRFDVDTRKQQLTLTNR